MYDSVDRIIDSFCFHPSIMNIKCSYKTTSKFSFKSVSEEFVKDINCDTFTRQFIAEEFFFLLIFCHHLESYFKKNGSEGYTGSPNEKTVLSINFST